MYIVDRSVRFLRGALLSFGPESLRRRVWDKEYRSEKWKFAYSTAGDCVYGHLKRYAKGGAILDMGCGSGNTSTELADSAYSSYTGVDIAEGALEKARRRSEECGRQNKNRYVCSDFFSYEPNGKFDVILFRESMYHVPIGRIQKLLDKLAPYLKDNGVFIIRLYVTDIENGQQKQRPVAMLELMEKVCQVVEKQEYGEAGRPTVLVLRPVGAAATRAGGGRESDRVTAAQA